MKYVLGALGQNMKELVGAGLWILVP